MKHISILLFVCMAIGSVFAQRPASENFTTSKGELTVQPVFHGSLVLSWNKKTIYVDPYGGSKAFAGLAAADFVLITDIHPDHLDVKTLDSIKISKAVFIVPKAVADQLPKTLKNKVIILNNGETSNQGEIIISAIPMYNIPESPDSKHTKGRGNGYVIKLGGKTVYLSGDTGDIPEMRSLKNIDIAFVCMNLPYTMDVEHAASAVLEFMPHVVYPYHYRGKDGLSDVEKFKMLVNTGSPAIDVRLRNWYPEYK